MSIQKAKIVYVRSKQNQIAVVLKENDNSLH